MPTLRDLFHSLSNIFHKMALSLGVTRDDLEFEPLENLSKEKLKEKNEALINNLKKLEEYVIEANGILEKIKDIIYSSIDPNKEFQTDK